VNEAVERFVALQKHLDLNGTYWRAIHRQVPG
jgi:hypothetical protein